jgi:hypothetical protein
MTTERAELALLTITRLASLLPLAPPQLLWNSFPWNCSAYLIGKLSSFVHSSYVIQRN